MSRRKKSFLQVCQSFGMSSAAEYPRSLRSICLTLVYWYSSSCDILLDADRYRTYPITQWLINVEEYESLIKSSTSTGNLISLVFYSWEMLRRELKVHPTASSTLILSDMNFLLVYNWKGLERNALVNTYSTRVSNCITCFKMLFSNAQSSGQPGGSPALYFHQQWWCTGLSPAYLSPLS